MKFECLTVNFMKITHLNAECLAGSVAALVFGFSSDVS